MKLADLKAGVVVRSANTGFQSQRRIRYGIITSDEPIKVLTRLKGRPNYLARVRWNGSASDELVNLIGLEVFNGKVGHRLAG